MKEEIIAVGAKTDGSQRRLLNQAFSKDPILNWELSIRIFAEKLKDKT